MTREELIEEAAATIAVAELVSTRRTWGDLLEPQKDEYRRVASAVFAVFEKAQCKRCGKIAEGYAFIGDDRYCHPDDGVDCYTLASHDLTSLANHAFIEKAQAPTDDERESYLPPDLYNKLMAHLLTASGRDGLFLADEVRNATGASKLRRPAQTEPTDAQCDAITQALIDHDRDSLTCYDHDRVCCPCGAHDMAMLEWQRHRARAAFTAGQEEQS